MIIIQYPQFDMVSFSMKLGLFFVLKLIFKWYIKSVNGILSGILIHVEAI